MINAYRVDLDFMAVYLLYPEGFLHHPGKEFLSAENLMTAAKGFNLREYPVKSLHAESHGIGVVDDPGIRTMGFDGFPDFLKHGQGTHGAQNTAGAGGVPYGLKNAVFLWGMHIGFHLVKGAGKNGNHHKVGAGESFCKSGNSAIVPAGFSAFGVAELIADDFIICAGAKVDSGAVLVHTFVGQATSLTRLFSAHDSLFFANCACENGEAAAIFAGPYTVTMHKSSLLIAGMFSFLNAGSGSNQSNHMYKLGPIHQGVVDRGSKTTSDSYILWPAHIGAFSLVMGRHVSHSDTSRLPFSYLIEKAGESHLVPGVNLKSVGTIRDAMKWPKRDKRRTARKLDYINFNLLSPYTVSKMIDGITLLNDIETTSGDTSAIYSYQGMTISASALRKGRMYYNMAIDKFMGNSVLKRLEGMQITCDEDIRRRLQPQMAEGVGEWVDIAGLIAPKNEIKRLCIDIAQGTITSLAEVNSRLQTLGENYYELEWTWVAENFHRWWGKNCDELTVADIKAIAGRWVESVVKLDRMLYDDARKEFSSVARIGFGIDASARSARVDFEQVRGEFERDPFVKMVLDHIAAKTALHDDLISRLPQ